MPTDINITTKVEENMQKCTLIIQMCSTKKEIKAESKWLADLLSSTPNDEYHVSGAIDSIETEIGNLDRIYNLLIKQFY